MTMNGQPDHHRDDAAKPPPFIRFGKRRIALPANRILRIGLGLGLIVLGLLGFLPVLGFWMVPLGIIVLSVDFALMRRMRRKGEVLLGDTIRDNRARSDPDRNASGDT